MAMINRLGYPRQYRYFPSFVSLLTCTLLGLASAEVAPSYESLWRWATVYHDDQNPILQEFKWRGRYHGQYYDVDAKEGSASGWEDRRARFGFDAALGDRQLEIRLDFQSSDGFEEFYDGLVDANLRWIPSDVWSITVGKQQPLIAYYEWINSSNELPFFERSQVFNQLQVNRATGVVIEGSLDGFKWQAGLYSNTTPPNTGGSGRWGDGEWGDLDGGISFGGGLGYEWKPAGSVDRTVFRIDWLHSEREADDLVLARYDDVISSTLLIRRDRWQFVLEACHASGGDHGDVLGCYLLPTYVLVPDRWKLVGRYSFSLGNGSASLLAQSRYEQEAIPGVETNRFRGDEYHAMYLGAEYFFYGDKLKWMMGVEWSQLSRGADTVYRGTTALTGVRFSF
jgi:hypothetical protein